LPDAEATKLGLDLAAPPRVDEEDHRRMPVTDWSVEPKSYGEFLCAIFDEWVKRDIGKTFVQIFDVTLGNWMGGPHRGGLCVFSETCGTALAMEHDGEVYSCDHYVYPRYQLGNILNRSLGEMVNSEFQRAFGEAKADTLPRTANVPSTGSSARRTVRPDSTICAGLTNAFSTTPLPPCSAWGRCCARVALPRRSCARVSDQSPARKSNARS